jgi:hypothetical protein
VIGSGPPARRARYVAAVMRLAAAVTALAVVLAGCHNYTAIKPTELPRLVGPTAGVTDDGRAIAVATRTVETPDGRMVEIRGSFELVIADSSGEVELAGPFQVSIEDGMLIVKSGSHSPLRTPLADVRSVQVKQGDGGARNLLGAILVVVLLVGTVALVTSV